MIIVIDISSPFNPKIVLKSNVITLYNLKELLNSIDWNISPDIDDIAIMRLSEKDVVRHRLVQEIIKAYERNEEQNERKN